MLNTQAIINFELSVDSKNLEEEMDKLINENEKLDKRIKTLKAENLNTQDKLINNDRNLYSIDEEDKMRDLRKKQRQNQAVIEKLRLDLKQFSKNTREKELRGEDDDEEENTIKDTTRPCARCCMF